MLELLLDCQNPHICLSRSLLEDGDGVETAQGMVLKFAVVHWGSSQ
jgi:hypothetical protein